MTKRLDSPELSQLSQELGEWRAQRGPRRLSIPSEFMERAAAAAAAVGAAHVAYRLRLNRARLDRFIAEREAPGGSTAPQVDFVPITLPSEAAGAGEVTVISRPGMGTDCSYNCTRAPAGMSQGSYLPFLELKGDSGQPSDADIRGH
jgi:hypothetical protein